ncbi:MAG: protein kinase [Acidobacteriota bacterium]
MKICSVCHHCYEDADITCEQEEHGLLTTARPGTRLIADKYRLDSMLARGGMGTVYAGTHVELDRSVAIKLLLPNFNTDPQAFERFRREARAAARIKHPNVADIYDYGALANDEAYIVMELVEGETLHERLKREGQLPVAETVAISRQITEGLEAAHLSGVVHRDLKPSNVIITRLNRPDSDAGSSLQVKIIDFGIAKISEQINADESALTATGMLVGTPRYMSPEQCLGEELDARSDIYSFGLIVYEMLAGQPPFEATSAVALAFKHIHEPPAQLEQYRQNLPPALASLIADSLSVEPSQRPQTATELKQRLDQIEIALDEQAVPDQAGAVLPVESLVEEADPLRTQVINAEAEPADVSIDDYATAVIEAEPGEKEAVAEAGLPDKDDSKPRPFFDVKTGEIKQAVPLTVAPVATDDRAQPVSAAVNASGGTRLRRQGALAYAGIACVFVFGVIALWAITHRKSPEAEVTAAVPVAAQLSKPGSSPTPDASVSPAPVTEEGTPALEQAHAEIGGALNDWIASTNAGDINTQMSFYNPTVEAFYLARNVSRDAVRAEKQRLYEQADKIEVQASRPQIKLSKDGQTATTRFNKRYVIEGSQENRQGEVIQELRWLKTDDGWKIVSERDVRVIRNPNKASSSPRKSNSSKWPHQIVIKGFKKLIQPIR